MIHIANCARATSLFLLLLLTISVSSGQGKTAGVNDSKVSTPVVDETLPTALQLYRDYIKASGGLAHLAELNSIKMSGYMILGEGGDKVPVSIFRKRPNKMRVKIEFPGHTTETIFDGKVGVRRYLNASDELVQNEDIVGEELEQISRSGSMDGLFHQLGARLDEAESIAWDEVSGVPSIRIDLIEGNHFGYQVIWLDKETLQENKLMKVLKDSKTGENAVEEVFFEEMDQTGGYFFPRVSRTFIDGELQKELHIERIRVNPGIFDSFFKVR